MSLTINGNPVPSSNLLIEPQRIVCTSELINGQNDISFSAYDTVGRPLYYSTTIWAGTRTFHINIVNENGLPVTDPVIVEARLADDQSVMVQATTTDGNVEFWNFPDRTILIKASTADNRFGLTGVLGWQGSAEVHLYDFNTASPIDNNDFSLGTEGWDIGTAPVQIAEHIDGFPQVQMLSVSTIKGERSFF